MMAQAQKQLVILDSSTNEDLFVCGLCKAVFNSLQLFVDHKNLPCVQPESVPIDYQEFQSSVNHSNNWLPFGNNDQQLELFKEPQSNTISCKVCKKEFKALKYLYSHLKLHEKPTQCPVCGRCFQTTSHQKRHIDTHKVWPDGLNETTPRSSDVELLSYSCSYCTAVLSNYTQFRAHLNNHLSLKKFKCIQGECNEFFDTVDDLLHHVEQYHNIIKYTCHVCKKDFLSLPEMAIHQQSYKECNENSKVVKTNSFKCSQCDATFRRHEKLSLHLLTQNHNKSCVLCKKSFASDKRLRTHLLIHKRSKLFQCNVCNSTFHMKKYLTTHMLRHGDRQFVCSICKQSFKRQDVLQRHLKIHTQRKMLKCPFNDIDECNKQYSRKDKLKQHLKSHTRCLKACTMRPSESNEAGTMEICIVPLDASCIEEHIGYDTNKIE